MSLLARRRSSQQPVPQLLPAPSGPYSPQQSPSDYDPRIRGTKVHDFSAPRPKRNTSLDNVQDLKTSSGRLSWLVPTDDRNEKALEDGELSPWSAGGHTPVFKEDFEDQQYPAAGPHVRKANDFSDLSIPRPAYAREAQSSKENVPKTSKAETDAPAAAQASEPSVKEDLQITDSPDRSNDTLADAEETHFQNLSTSSHRRHSSYSPSTLQCQLINVSTISDRESVSTVPQHMKSNSSRFSFDMIGGASQEKLLEDRHREKALKNQTSIPGPYTEGYDDEDEFDYENMMDDDGLEERIPGVNADLEDEEEFCPQQSGISEFIFQSMGTSLVPSPLCPSTPGVLNTPRDLEGNVIGFAMTMQPPHEAQGESSQSSNAIEPQDVNSQSLAKHTASDQDLNGLGLQGINIGDSLVQHASNQQSNFPQNNVREQILDEDDMYFDDGLIDLSQNNVREQILDEDDMYFDDGLIDLPGDLPEGPEFDESVFDNEDTDQFGRPLRPLSSLPTLYSPPLAHTNSESLRNSRRESAEEKNAHHGQDETNQPDRLMSITLEPHPSVISPKPLQPTTSLTQDTLSAYQSALAAAAHAAAANGRFRRDSTAGAYFDDSNSSPDKTQLYSPSLEDDFDYDDAYEDDPIIAEANAEALAYDSDGFYSQEFGFYSAPAGGEAMYANGGFFGPRGSEGITRSQSGRVREANLTPITERSEYSNRNSIMSLPQLATTLSHGSASVASPGLAQLAGMLSDHDDENMSLSALLKLRRGAWAGSQTSLPASGGGSPSQTFFGDDHGLSSPTGHGTHAQQRRMSSSPSGQMAPWQQGQASSSPAETRAPWQQGQASSSPVETRGPWPPGNALANARRSSAFSLASDTGRDSDASSSNASPNVPTSRPAKPQLQTQGPLSRGDSTHHPAASAAPSLPSPAGLASSPAAAHFDVDGSAGGAEKGLRRHRHTRSNDSISYMKEEDPVSGERWVLERRRTGESGEVELLGREVVSGGRI